MKLSAILAGALLPLASLAGAWPWSADTLIDEAITEPGNWIQMCATPPATDPKVPLPIYSPVGWPEFRLSEENLERLRARRSVVVAALVRRLAKLDFTKPPAPSQPERLDPHYYNVLMLEMVRKLNAVEALPALLHAEAQLADLLEKAEADPSVAPPQLQADHLIVLDASPARNGKEEAGQRARHMRTYRLVNARVAQREMLSTMLILLRAERFEPLLNFDLEKLYAHKIKQVARTKKLKDIKTAADIPEKDRPWVGFDPILNLPMNHFGLSLTVPFTPQLRVQIRGLAEQFLQTIPPKKWKAGSAMPMP